MKEYRLLKKTCKVLSAFSFTISLSLIVISCCTDSDWVFSFIACFCLGLFAGMVITYMIILKEQDEKFTEETIERIRENLASMNLKNTHNVE